MSSKDWNRKQSCKIQIEPSYPDILDTIIIGAGPAGMTAAVYAARRKMKTLFISGKTGGQLTWSSDIRNWTGIIRSTGPILAHQMMSHVKTYRFDRSEFDLYLLENEFVDSIEKYEGGLFKITTKNEVQHFLAKTVIITCGKRARMLGIPGEDIAQKGNGLSFSATSDAPLYKGKKMVVIGGGNSAKDVALQLAKITDDITLMTNLPELVGEACLSQRILSNENIKVIYSTNAQEILLDETPWVKGVRYTDSQGKEQIIECQGVFESVGQIPNTGWIQDFIELDEREQIITTKDCETSQPGVFAAGDCCNNKFKQVVIAAGQGAVCALQAHQYIQKMAE